MTLDSKSLGTDLRLPMNYFPIALPALAGAQGPDGLVVPIGDEARPGLRNAFPFVELSTTELADPQETERKISKEFGNDPTVLLLKPAMGFPDAKPNESAFPALDCDNSTGAIGIIDIGIAFWNKTFRTANKCRFQAVNFIDFSNPAKVFRTLDHTEIQDYCAKADAPGGATTVIRDLAAFSPESVYAQDPLPGSFHHGTAIADLAGGNTSEGSTADLFAVELPVRVLQDPTGTTLEAMLFLALRNMLLMTKSLPDGVPLTIKLAFGYPGGPQNGYYPAIAAIEKAIEQIQPGRQISLVLPAGNHLQDQCFAVFDFEGTGQSVLWHMPPDDASVNTMDLCFRGDLPDIELQSPCGGAHSVSLAAGELKQLTINGQQIGCLFYDPNPMDGWSTVRFSMHPSRTDPNLAPLPFGDWKLSVQPCHSDVKCWIRRDEDTRYAGLSKTRRSSFFRDPGYREFDANGALRLDNDQDCRVQRLGTASLLTSAEGKRVKTVEALEKKTARAAPSLAPYSGRKHTGRAMTYGVLVDDHITGMGLDVKGNGSSQNFRLSGTSAAAGKHS